MKFNNLTQTIPLELKRREGLFYIVETTFRNCYTLRKSKLSIVNLP